MESEGLELGLTENPQLNVGSKNPDRDTQYEEWEPYSEELWELGSGPSKTSQDTTSGPSMSLSRSLISKNTTTGVGTHANRNLGWASAWALDHVFGGPPSTDVPNPSRNDTPARECMICIESKSWEHFPENSPSAKCQHVPNTCLECLETHIKTQLESEIFHEKIIRCPECSVILDSTEIQKFSDSKTFEL
jgi:hypothetical protein